MDPVKLLSEWAHWFTLYQAGEETPEGAPYMRTRTLLVDAGQTWEAAVDGVGDGFRVCEFCGCRTNAFLRACCDKGRAADLAPPPLDELTVWLESAPVDAACPRCKRLDCGEFGGCAPPRCWCGMEKRAGAVSCCPPHDLMARRLGP